MKEYSIDGRTVLLHDGRLWVEAAEVVQADDQEGSEEERAEPAAPERTGRGRPKGFGKFKEAPVVSKREVSKKQVILEKLDAGMTAKEIADALGCSLSSVYTTKSKFWKRDTVGMSKKQPLGPAALEAFYESHADGMSVEDLAVEYGITEGQVEHLVNNKVKYDLNEDIGKLATRRSAKRSAYAQIDDELRNDELLQDL